MVPIEIIWNKPLRHSQITTRKPLPCAIASGSGEQNPHADFAVRYGIADVNSGLLLGWPAVQHTPKSVLQRLPIRNVHRYTPARCVRKERNWRGTPGAVPGFRRPNLAAPVDIIANRERPGRRRRTLSLRPFACPNLDHLSDAFAGRVRDLALFAEIELPPRAPKRCPPSGRNPGQPGTGIWLRCDCYVLAGTARLGRRYSVRL